MCDPMICWVIGHSGVICVFLMFLPVLLIKALNTAKKVMELLCNSHGIFLFRKCKNLDDITMVITLPNANISLWVYILLAFQPFCICLDTNS